MEKKGLNANEVLANVEELIAEAEATKTVSKSYWWSKPVTKQKVYKTWDVCDRLEIFDWWVETLSVTNLKKMRSFLKAAIKRGFCGYVCFKVGASGCANGMWAHKEESADGYSPDGAFLYHSFTPDYSCWDVFDGKGVSASKILGGRYDDVTLKDVDRIIETLGI